MSFRSLHESTPPEVAQLHDGISLAQALTAPIEKLGDQRRDLFSYFLATASAAYRSQLDVLRKAREQRSKTVDGLREIMVMRELPQPRPTFVLDRGAYNAPKDRVQASTPSVFPPFPKNQPRNRLGLARWLTSPSHPLTARVAVNHFWQTCFGQGLVRTPEDFGNQGEPPTHPQLLDSLARDFVQHGWDVKRLLRTIVLSATYRQSSKVSKEVRARDPENRLLARGPVYQLSAEMLRDNALAVSGLLVDKIGGPPVRPYEVEVSFKPAKRDKGEGLYRRSVYTYWKRTGPAPVMMTLDASKRDVCRVKRERTSSPLKTLVLLNSPQFVEAARVLGQRLLAKHGASTVRALTDLFRLLTSRKPSPAELRLLVKLFNKQLGYFEKHPERATAFLSVGDSKPDASISKARLAAIGVVASTLMNFSESTMKR